MSLPCDQSLSRLCRSTLLPMLAMVLCATPGESLADAPPCDCIWNNGVPAPLAPSSLSGIVSHEGGAIPLGFKAADDFYLPSGSIHRLKSISVDMVTSSFPGLAKARLELYEDCNGQPGRLLYSFSRPRVSSGGPIGLDDLRSVQFTFVADEQGAPGTVNPPIALRGGTYWVSVVGVSDGQCPMGMCDRTYWLAADGPVKGRVAHKLSGVPSMVPYVYSYAGQSWQPVDECCAGCIDLSFSVCADSCKILLDNGGPDLTRYSMSLSGSLLLAEARTADDFVVPPCSDQQLCYVQGFIATNCNPPNVRLDIYDAACTLPATFSPPIRFPASRITPTGDVVTIDGRQLPVYRVEFWDFRVFGGQEPLTLVSGVNYWMSIYTVASGSVNERGYVLGANRCALSGCGSTFRRFNPAAVSGFAFGITDFTWRPVDPIAGSTFDLGFTVATRPVPTAATSANAGACLADFDADGRVSVQDVFEFLNRWYAGCP